MTRTRIISAIAFLAALCSFLPAPIRAQASQSVHVLHGSGNALQAAIDAAAEGDTLLLRGHYGPIHINGKSLTLVSEDTWWVSAQSMTISNIAAHQSVTISGLTTDTPVGGSIESFAPGIVIDHCAGSVRLMRMNCVVRAPATHAALTVNQSSNVVLTQLHLFGSYYGENSSPPPLATTVSETLRITRSRVALYDCTVDGGDGSFGVAPAPCSAQTPAERQRPSAGLAIDAQSSLFAWRTYFSGGTGGQGVPAVCDCSTGSVIQALNGFDGAPAIRNESGAFVALDACALFAGVGGAGGAAAFCPQATGGEGLTGASGAQSTNPVQVLPPTGSNWLGGPRVVRAGQLLQFNLQGATGALAQIGWSLETQFVPLQGASGVLQIGPSGRRATIGTLPPGSFGAGSALIQFPAQLTTPGAQAETWRFQLFTDSPTGLHAGPVWDVIVLDPSF